MDLNDNMRELCGMTDDNPENKRFWETVCMFDVPLLRNIYSPDSRSDMLVCQHMDYPEMGINRYIEFFILPLFNSDGEICNYFITVLDITDDRNRDHDRHLHDKEVQAIRTDIERKKQTLAFLLEHSDRHLEQGDDGRMRIVVDNTRIEEARRQLQAVTTLADESVRLKSGFMASMTHELRTPLNAIAGFTSVLDTLGDNPERGEYVRIIRNSSDMLQRLINDIIEASSISGGTLTIKPGTIDFQEPEVHQGESLRYLRHHARFRAHPAGAHQLRHQRREVHRTGPRPTGLPLREARHVPLLRGHRHWHP